MCNLINIGNSQDNAAAFKSNQSFLTKNSGDFYLVDKISKASFALLLFMALNSRTKPEKKVPDIAENLILHSFSDDTF